MPLTRLALTVLLALLALAAPPAWAASLPYTIKFQVYEGPHSKTGEGWKSKTVELVPGTKAAEEFVENYGRSNPGLVAAYQELTEPSRFTSFLKELMALKGTRPTVTLVDDTRKFVDRDGDGQPDTDEKAEDERGVWPHARGNDLFISQSYLGSYPNLDSVHHLLIHELSHTQDDTNRGRGDYGPDDTHFGDEVLYNHGVNLWIRRFGARFSQKAAFVEGFAEFTPLMFDPEARAGTVADVVEIRRETSKGKYETKPWKDASYDELISVEHVNALILFDVYRFVPDGKAKLIAAFKATNRGSRTLIDLLAQLARDNPADAFAVAAIFDAYTGFKAPDSALEKLLGKDLAERYRKEQRDAAKAKNPDGSVQNAERVGRWAAANLRVASAESALAAMDRRIAELSGWKLSPWDLLGGAGSFLVRNLLHHREQRQLEARRKQLAAELARLKAERSKPTAALKPVFVLPAPATLPTTLALESSPPTPPRTAPRPAQSFEGAPVEWGR